MNRALLFDLDHTLYDAALFYRGAFRDIAEHLARRHGRTAVPLSEALFGLWRRLTSAHPRLFDCFLEEEGLPLDETPALIDILHRHRPLLELYPDAAGLIEAARAAGTRLGIITDGHGMMQRNKVRALGLHDHFEPIVFTADHGGSWRKPSPFAFTLACRALGVRPEEAIYVGDNPHVDGAAAFAAGIPAVRLLRGEYRDHHPPQERLFVAEIEALDGLHRRRFPARPRLDRAG
ncbi:MAG: HAD family hydrolase [Planctomycetota bacterium]